MELNNALVLFNFIIASYFIYALSAGSRQKQLIPVDQKLNVKLK